MQDSSGLSERDWEYVPIDPRRAIVSVQAATWFEEKQAACSLEFDDTRTTHYTIAAPELEARGFRGTFNLVTGQVGDWRAWQRLYDHGHEIANHTRDHLYFSEITPEDAKVQIALGAEDILQNLTGMKFVPSFVYPGGDVPDWSEELVARFHVCARGGHGVESADPQDILCIKGCGYYAPFSLPAMNANLDVAIATGGWYVPYYHSFTDDPYGWYLYCPRHIFIAHLDYIASWTDELWVAPQGEVARYILERQNFHYEWMAGDEIALLINTGLDPERFDLPLTLLLRLHPGLGELKLTVEERELRIPAGTEQVALNLVPGRAYVIRMAARRPHEHEDAIVGMEARQEPDLAELVKQDPQPGQAGSPPRTRHRADHLHQGLHAR